MSNSYKISIAVPIYGVEKYIERCARSLFEQTYHDIEYIFIDDCCKDRSMDILLDVLDSYPDRKPYAQVIRHEKNRGLSAARNTAIENCKTDWIVHVDSDDWMDEHCIELLVKTQIETNADIVKSAAIYYWPSGKIETFHGFCIDSKDSALKHILSQDFRTHTVWGKLIRKSLYDNNSIKAIEGVNIGEDWQVIFPLVYYADKVSNCPNAIYHHDKTNEKSYTSSKTYFEKQGYLSEFKTIDFVRSFILEKKMNYVDLLNDTEFQLIHRFLPYTVKMRQKQAFSYLIKRLKGCQKEQNNIKDMLKGNYYVFGAYLNYLEIISRFKINAMVNDA